MTKSPETAKSLFGIPGRNSIWATDFLPSRANELSSSIELPEKHLIAVYQLRGEFHFDSTDLGDETYAETGLVIAKTGSGKSSLVAGPTFSGVVIGFSEASIRSVLDAHRPGLASDLRDTIFSTAEAKPVRRQISSYFVEKWIPEMRNPPVSGSAAVFWYEAKIREFIALACFHDKQPKETFFCSRQKILASDRITQVKNYLADHIDENLSLEKLSQYVGCSRHYLSRTFSEFTGNTISQYLRRLRIERAAELLISGRFNVSEVAVEVGYQSLSHFSKAFFQEKGCLPSKYDNTAA